MRLVVALVALALIGAVPLDRLLIGALAFGSICGVLALILVLRLWARWEQQARENLEGASRVWADAAAVDELHRGTDA